MGEISQKHPQKIGDAFKNYSTGTNIFVYILFCIYLQMFHWEIFLEVSGKTQIFLFVSLSTHSLSEIQENIT